VQRVAAVAQEVGVLGRQVDDEDVEAACRQDRHHRVHARAAVGADGCQEGYALAVSEQA
jgi:hypothetical protein